MNIPQLRILGPIPSSHLPHTTEQYKIYVFDLVHVIQSEINSEDYKE